MKQVTATGPTVDEAVQNGLKELNATIEQVEMTIVDEGKRGILGIFGARPAIVKLKLKIDPVEETVKFLQNVCAQMDVSVEIDIKTEGKHVYFNLQSEKAGFLIGKRGQTLNALQSLAQLVLNKYTDQFKLLHLDVENYRSRREESLIQLAHRLANKAVREKRKISLEPMPAYERRIIHTALSDHEKVTTYSVGTEPKRHLIIEPK